MKIIRKNLNDLKRPERNVRMHTDKQLHEFRRSIEMFGQIRPIVIDENNVILAGNGLYETLLSMGRTEADCYVVTGLSEAGKKKLMLADNRVFNLGVDDLAVFDAFILELKDDLDIPGFEEDLLKSLVMEADEATDALKSYGTIDKDHADNIRAAHGRSESMGEAPASPAGEIPPAPAGTGDASAHESILCPKCGERIWL